MIKGPFGVHSTGRTRLPCGYTVPRNLVATQDVCQYFRVTTQKKPSNDDSSHTPIRRFRAPDDLWEAYESVCRRIFQRERSEDLVEHMVTTVRAHGDATELEKLARAEAELAERRARKGGRPRKEDSR